MYDNQFRSKNDPILESIQGILQDGDLRARAEQLANEEFDVYSRQALIAEEIPAYEATVEEYYKALKDGEQIDEISKGLVRRYANKAFTLPGTKEQALRHAKGTVLASKKIHGGAKVRTTKEETEVDEEVMKQVAYRPDVARTTLKKQQPKKVRYNRFANPGAVTAVKGLGSIAEEEQIDELSKEKVSDHKRKALGEYSRLQNKLKRHGLSNDETKVYHKRATGYGLAKAKLDGRARVPANEEKEDAPFKGGHDVASRFKREQDSEKQQHSVVKNSRKARYAKLAKMRKEEVEQIDELSREKLQKVDKAEAKAASKTYREMDKLRTKYDAEDWSKKEHEKRTKGYIMAHNKLTGLAKVNAGEKKPPKKADKPESSYAIVGLGRALRKKVAEDVFEELYININEQALLAIENNTLEQFVEGLTEEEFEFLDEEIVNELSGFGAAFAANRAKLGAGKTFTYKGKSYSTNRADDVKATPTPPKRPGSFGSNVPLPPKRPASTTDIGQNISAMKTGQAQARNDASTIRSTNSAVRNPTVSEPTAKGSVQAAVSPSAAASAHFSATPGSAADKGALATSMAASGVTPGEKKEVGVGTGTAAIKAAQQQKPMTSHLGGLIKSRPIQESAFEAAGFEEPTPTPVAMPQSGGLLAAVGLTEETTDSKTVKVGGMDYRIV